jgi:hypothetical protein
MPNGMVVLCGVFPSGIDNLDVGNRSLIAVIRLSFESTPFGSTTL